MLHAELHGAHQRSSCTASTFWSPSSTSTILAKRPARVFGKWAEQGHWPSVAPIGYRTNRDTKRIEIDPERGVRRREPPRYVKHRCAYTGLLTCGACGCAITAERKKGRYVYYHCTGYRGPCRSGYVREEVLTELLAEVVGRIQLTAEQADWIARALRESQAEKEREHRRALLLQQQRYQQVQQMLDRAYEDRLAGTISEDLWLRRSREWELELSRLRTDLSRRETASNRHMIAGSQIIELAPDANSTVPAAGSDRTAETAEMLLSNCTLQAGTLCPTYRRPFDVLAGGNETGNWLGGRDSNPDNVVQRAVHAFARASFRAFSRCFIRDHLRLPPSVCVRSRAACLFVSQGPLARRGMSGRHRAVPPPTTSTGPHKCRNAAAGHKLTGDGQIARLVRSVE